MYLRRQQTNLRKEGVEREQQIQEIWKTAPSAPGSQLDMQGKERVSEDSQVTGSGTWLEGWWCHACRGNRSDEPKQLSLKHSELEVQMTLEQHGSELHLNVDFFLFINMVQYYKCIFLHNFLIAFFSLAHFIIRIQYMTYITWKIRVYLLFMESFWSTVGY